MAWAQAGTSVARYVGKCVQSSSITSRPGHATQCPRPRRGGEAASFTLRHHNSTNSTGQTIAMPHWVARRAMACSPNGSLREPARGGARTRPSPVLPVRRTLVMAPTGRARRRALTWCCGNMPVRAKPTSPATSSPPRPRVAGVRPSEQKSRPSHGRGDGHQIVDHRSGRPGGLAQRRRQHQRAGQILRDVAGVEPAGLGRGPIAGHRHAGTHRFEQGGVGAKVAGEALGHHATTATTTPLAAWPGTRHAHSARRGADHGRVGAAGRTQPTSAASD